VDIVGVRPVSSGYMLRFAYRVLDPVKAAPLFDERTKPIFTTRRAAREWRCRRWKTSASCARRRSRWPTHLFRHLRQSRAVVNRAVTVRIVVGRFEIDDLIVD